MRFIYSTKLQCRGEGSIANIAILILKHDKPVATSRNTYEKPG